MEENKKKKISTKDMVQIAMFTAVVAVLSQIAIPMPSEVPVTLQTLAVALCGYVLGSKKGAVSLLVYALLGAVGAPVFANFKGGLGAIAGPTGGFIWGFIFMAAQFAIIKGNGFWSSALLVSVPYLVKDFVSVIIALGAAALIRSRIKVTAAANQ